MNNYIQIMGDTLKIGNLSLTFSLSGVVEMIIFAVVSYYLILWFKKTKAWTLLKGAAFLLLLYILARILKLNNIVSLFESAIGSIVIAAIVILQPELRKALEQLGNKNLLTDVMFRGTGEENGGLTEESVEAIIRALTILGRNRVGALIIIERTIDLKEYAETGITLDSSISSALLEQVFVHNTPLHDGAVIIRRNRIVAATCYLPLSQNTEISKELGTRHRAGLGVSEVSDCITLIASEETGMLSVAISGVLYRNRTPDEIREVLLQGAQHGEKTRGHSPFFKVRKGADRDEE